MRYVNYIDRMGRDLLVEMSESALACQCLLLISDADRGMERAIAKGDTRVMRKNLAGKASPYPCSIVNMLFHRWEGLAVPAQRSHQHTSTTRCMCD